MRQLLPPTGAVQDVASAYAAHPRPAPPDRPWVVLNMVVSIDGAVTVDGRSGGLGGAGDHEVFHCLRALADDILVGAGTATAESYGPPRASAEVQAARLARGQAAFPRLVVVSGRLTMDPGARYFSNPANRPTVLTHRRADPTRRAALAEVADIIEAGDGAVDLAEGLAHLREQGVQTVLCEGGPALAGSLAQDDLIDELCTTIAPWLVAGDSTRMAWSPVAVHHAFVLDHVLEQDGELFLRHHRAR